MNSSSSSSSTIQGTNQPILLLTRNLTAMVSSANADEQSQRHMMHEIWDTISKVTNQLTALGKSTARSGQENNEADSGSRIITLAGENKGATVKANLEEMMDTCGALYYDDESLMTAYTNSNYQAINNSILVGGSYAAEDPGVHLVISDYVGEHGDDGDQESHWKKKDKKEKKAKKDKDKEEKKKKKKKDGSKGEKQSEDDETSGDSE